MKSGKDLWNGWIGWLILACSANNDWIDSRMARTISCSKPNSVAIAGSERGFVMRTTAPRTERTVASSSSFSSGKAAKKIDVYRESRLLYTYNLVWPSCIVLSGDFMMILS